MASVAYTFPFDKFPLTNWISGNTKYTGTFNWQRAPLGQSSFGNTIQNNRAINMTLQGNFITLYNKSPFLKKVLGAGQQPDTGAEIWIAGLLFLTLSGAGVLLQKRIA